MTGRESCIVFNLLSGVGFAKFNAMSSHFGSPGGALEASMSELLQIKGIGEQLSRSIANWRDEVDLERELELAERANARILTLLDDDFPPVLRQLPDPPLCVYATGVLPDFDRNDFVGIVGSRRASHYGRRMAAKLSEEAVLANWGTVSGLALGIDREVHLSTVNARGVTVAVLGGGLGRVHPREHEPLAARIAEEGGAVISEFPMTFPVNRRSFPRRNRLIAGLGRGVIVVEAGLKSGALITADYAASYRKHLFAVPANADNPMVSGCNRLIKEGKAMLVENFADVERAFYPEGSPREDLFAEIREAPADYFAEPPTTSTPEQRILNYLRDNGESSFDQLASGLDVPSGELAGIMIKMELRQLVRQLPGKRFILNL